LIDKILDGFNNNSERLQMIKVDPQEFMEQGYIIVRQLVPSDLLEPLRDSSETVMHRRWPEGIPPETFQPMIHGLERWIDADTANLVEFCLHENLLEPTRQLMGGVGSLEDGVGPLGSGVEVGPSAIFMMCNPVCDHGPWFWHRDVSPLGNKGPLQGLQMDTMANGPVHLHWNVALYDDDVYWVVPGSHVRPNTDAENRQLSAVPHSYAHGQRPQGEKRHEPLPGSVCVDLKAGDAVVNHLELFHWGCNYGPKLRRTYHIGYRTFEGPRYFYEGFHTDIDFARYLTPQSRGLYEHWLQLYERECDVVEAVYRAIINGDEAGFRQGLARLHPGESARFVCLIHLCRMAQGMQQGKDELFCPRFSDEEVQELWRRFGPVDAALHSEGEVYISGLQIAGPSKYRLFDLPDNFGIEEFVDSWPAG
jgi:hypothetical protein